MPRRAGVQKELSRGVVKFVRVDGFQEGDFVDDVLKVGEEVRYPGAGLAILVKVGLRAEQLGDTLNKSEPFAFQERVRAVHTVVLVQFRLVVEEFKLRWGAGHMQEDDLFGPRGNVWGTDQERAAHVARLRGGGGRFTAHH